MKERAKKFPVNEITTLSLLCSSILGGVKMDDVHKQEWLDKIKLFKNPITRMAGNILLHIKATGDPNIIQEAKDLIVVLKKWYHTNHEFIKSFCKNK
ncbi:MAG: hypothetical protein AAB795_04430 [Patescibacteria group bacterium]